MQEQQVVLQRQMLLATGQNRLGANSTDVASIPPPHPSERLKSRVSDWRKSIGFVP